MKTATWLMLLLKAGMLMAQDSLPADSLLKKIRTAKEDSNQVMMLFRYGELFEQRQPDTALLYYNKAKALSEKLQYKKGLFTYCSYSIVILNNQGKFREALDLCRQTARLYESSADKNDLAAIYINTGSEWQYLSDLEAAAANYIKAAGLAEETGNKKFQRVSYNNLASVFNSLQQYEKGKKYAEKSLKIALEMKDDYAVASSLINLATSESFLKDHAASLARFKEVEMLGIKMDDPIIRMDGWLGMADNHKAMRQFGEAEKLYKDVVALSGQLAAPEYRLYGYMGLSSFLPEAKRYAEAKAVTDSGIALAQQLGTRLELKELYLRASQLHEATGQPLQALHYHKQFVSLNDSLINEKNTANINLLEIKFESGQKETQIKALEAEKKINQLQLRQQSTFNYILLGSAAGILLIALLARRNYHHKQQLQQQRIAELEKEKQLLATEAVLQGQEEERSRLARDLHDGLGGLLSGIKHSFVNMKENLFLTPENVERFQRGIDMLDTSITELRRVAHNMMPEALLKFGLHAALKDFCTGISSSGTLRVIFQSHDAEQLPLSQTASVTLYRVVQELLNNTLKHAAATEALVQLNREGSTIHLTVEDNGRGFDTGQLLHAKGMGWQNIKNRLDYLNARFEIQSAPGKGTSVNIEMDI